jgi:signal peptidase I
MQKKYQQDDLDKHDRKIQTRKSTFREYAEAAAIAILLALFIRTFVVQAFKIPSGSMKPTLLIGDHLLVNKFIYGIKIPFIDKFIIEFKKPKKGDIIVFKYPQNEKKDYIKRVIGTEGDKIEIKKGLLFVNEKQIREEYAGKFRDHEIFEINRYIEFLGKNEHYILGQDRKDENFGPITVPPNSIFVMGDNRDNSQDSRYWGFVKTNKIKGKALIIYWSSWPNWKRFFNLIR